MRGVDCRTLDASCLAIRRCIAIRMFNRVRVGYTNIDRSAKEKGVKAEAEVVKSWWVITTRNSFIP